MTDFFNLSMSKEQILQLSNLGLAHMGDAVFDLLVRAYLCAKGIKSAKSLHNNTVAIVSAKAQAAGVRGVLPMLNEQEQQVFNRGRNAKVNSVPKGASMEDYHLATGFETLLGFLYISGQTGRINELFNRFLECHEEE